MLFKTAEEERVEVNPNTRNQSQWYFNIYEISEVYGGSEEGGWYYTAGEPVESIKLKNPFPENAYISPQEDGGNEAYFEKENTEVDDFLKFFESKGYTFNGKNRFKTSPQQAEQEDFANAQRNYGPDEAAEVYLEGSKAMEEFAQGHPELLDKWYMDQYTDYSYRIEDHPGRSFPQQGQYYQ